MNVVDFIERAKRIINEAEGASGFVYILRTANNISALDNDILKISEITHEDGVCKARVEFKVNRDYGYALNSLKAVLGDIDIKSLELVY